MGNEAEELEIDQEVIEQPEEVGQEAEVDGENEGTHPQLTQEQVDDAVNKRLKRENRKTEEALKEAEQANAKLAQLEEKSKLLEIAMGQQFSEPENALPNPDDFDGGEFDPEYTKKKDAYLLGQVNQQVEQQVSEQLEKASQVSKQREAAQQLNLKKAQHNEGLVALGVKDVEKVQEVVTDILGGDAVDIVISSTKDSPVILNYLSKNEDEAYEIADLINSGDTFGALMTLGRLSAKLELKPSHKNAPDPVDDLEGATATSLTSLERKDQAMVKKYEADQISLQQLLEFRKKAKQEQT